MANEFLTTQDIARQALLRLNQQMVMVPLVHTDYSSEFKQKGDTIQVVKPNTFTANEFDGVQTVSQEIKESQVLVSLDKVVDITTKVTSKQMTLNIRDFTEQVINPAMEAIAAKVNADILGLYKDIPYWAGQSGVTPNDLSAFAEATRKLNEKNVPMANRRAVWDPGATAKLQIVPAIVNAEKSGTTEALREGSIGRIIGLDNYQSPAVVTHVAGAFTVHGDVTGNVAPPVPMPGNLAVPASMANLTSVAGLSGESLVKGDIFSIGNQQFVVLADAVANAGVINVQVHPAVAAPVNGPVTFPDQVKRAHVANMAFYRNAFAFVNRPLSVPMGGATGYNASYAGLSIRVVNGYDMDKKVDMISFDILYGVKTLDPRLAALILG